VHITPLTPRTVSQAAIHGLNGVRYAGSPELQVTMDQVRTLVEAIDNQPMAALLPLKGIWLGATKYTYLRHGTAQIA